MVGGKFKKDSSGGPNAASPGVSGGFLYFNVQYGLCTEEMIIYILALIIMVRQTEEKEKNKNQKESN